LREATPGASLIRSLLGKRSGALAQRYCTNCGAKLAEEVRFCPNCGRPVHETAAVSTPEADVSVPPPIQSGEGPKPRITLGTFVIDSEAAYRSSTPASMRAGGRPSRAVCGPSHRASEIAEKGLIPGGLVHAGAGAAELAERSAPRSSPVGAGCRNASGPSGALRGPSADSVRTL
jgi:hypothetical protein